MNLTVTVRPDGGIFLDKQRVSPDVLLLLLKEKTEGDSSFRVDLFADETVSYQELYRVLDIIRSAGIANVALQADTIQ